VAAMPPQAGAPAAALASECAQAGERRQRSDLRPVRDHGGTPCCAATGQPRPCPHPAGPQIQRTQLPRLRSAKRVEVGLGWLLARPPGAAGPVLWHNGGTSGFRSFVAVVREADTAVVVLSNTARSVGRLGQRLLKALSEDAG
jgi:hypothetical protein